MRSFRFPPFLMLLFATGAAAVAARADDLPSLATQFWDWRAREQPFTEDDIPRLERPADFAVDWSAARVEGWRKELAEFERRWRAINVAGEPVETQVDYRLMGSAIARVRWELEVEDGWQRNPMFYLHQTLGAVQILLLPPPPFQADRQAQIVARMESIPATIQAAEMNLVAMRRPFAQLAIDTLDSVSGRFAAVLDALVPMVDTGTRQKLLKASPEAIEALNNFRVWLQNRIAILPEETAIGREKYEYFLRQVALMPYTPEQILAMGSEEWERSVAFEAYERTRNAKLPPLALLPNQAAQIALEAKREQQIRDFLEARNILSVPTWLQHYRNLPLPDYVRPFSAMTVTDDLTGPSRLKENGTSYIRHPAPSLGFFALSTAKDPRPIIVHEGVPGHYMQLALSLANEHEIRRHYYDSGPNEGIGFYAEEMMLQAGLFDDSPRTREIIYSFMRLRALRVAVDVKLALGEFTLDEAAAYLAKTVPMDETTAKEEAAMFASTPGQAISYQVGKVQILRLLAAAREKEGDSFSLRKFHDYLWKNGNVPLSLLQWELLSDPGDVPPAAPARH